MTAVGPEVSDEASVRQIIPEDAPGLADLITRCYGDGYPKRIMYRPGELADLIRSGDHGGAVAEAGGKVVGHMAFNWPNADAKVVEAGITVVDPDWRGKGLMGRLALEMGRLLIEEGALGFVHYPTTAHTVMQRASLASGGRETGIMLAFLPPGTRDREIAEQGDHRLCVTVAYQPALEMPAQEVHLPERHSGRILGMAAALGLDRAAAPGGVPSREATRLDGSFDEAADIQHLRVVRIGDDIGERVGAAIAGVDARVVHVDLPMDDPGVDFAVERLLRDRFAFSAWLPAWAGHDVLRLQRVEAPTEAELSPTLFSPEAGALMASIRAELLGEG